MIINKNIWDIGLFKDYLETKNLREGTVNSYIECATRFLKCDPHIVNVEDYNIFLVKHAKKSFYNYHYGLRHYIKFKFEDKKVLKERMLNQLHKIPMRDPTTKRRNLTEEEIDKVIKNIEKSNHQLIAKLQKECGLRFCDVAWLKEENIFTEKHGKDEIIRLEITGKGGHSTVTFVFDKPLMVNLKQFVEENKTTSLLIDVTPYIFLRGIKLVKYQGNSHMLKSALYHHYWQDLKEALSSAGVHYKDWATHDFRRDFAKRCYEKFGRDIFLLQQALRHKDINTTVRYLRFSGLNVKEVLYKMQKKKYKILKEGVIDNAKVGDIVDVDNISNDAIEGLVTDKIIRRV